MSLWSNGRRAGRFQVSPNDHPSPASLSLAPYRFFRSVELIPADVDRARQLRFHDRMQDLYLEDAVTTLLFDSWKPANQRASE